MLPKYIKLTTINLNWQSCSVSSLLFCVLESECRRLSDRACAPTSPGVIKTRRFVYTTVIMYCEWEGQLKPGDPDLLCQWLGTNRARNVVGARLLYLLGLLLLCTICSFWISQSDVELTKFSVASTSVSVLQMCRNVDHVCLIQTVCPVQVSLTTPLPILPSL